MRKPKRPRFSRRGEQTIEAVQEAVRAAAMTRTEVGDDIVYGAEARLGRTRHVGEQLTDLIDPDHALREVARFAFSDVRDLFDERGNLRPVYELPDLAAAIASIKIVKRKTHVIQKVRFWDKPKALAMLLEHFGRRTSRGYGTIRTRPIANGNAWSACSWRMSP